jgi:hypothetical protein
MVKKYKTRYDGTGKTGKEAKIHGSFWRKYKVEDVMQLDGQEFEELLDHFFIWFEETQRKRIKNWWYPEDPAVTLYNGRYTKLTFDKKES